MKRAFVTVLLAVATLAFSVDPCFACSCAPGTKKGQAKGASAVFTGVVTKVEVEQPTGPVIGGEQTRAFFAVERVFKGSVPWEAVVISGTIGSSCSLRFREGRRYTVFADRARDGSLIATQCMGTRTGDIAPGKYGLKNKPALAGGPHGTSRVGTSVAGLPDRNQDGRPDLIIGAPSFKRPLAQGGAVRSGAVFVVHQPPSSKKLDLRRLGFHARRIDGGVVGDRAGHSVADAGDVNGDGAADLIVGAPGVNGGAGAAYVLLTLPKSPETPRFDDLGPHGFTISGPGPGSRAGWSVAASGDVNEDGFDDVLVGAPEADGDEPSSGSAYVVFGSPSPSDVPLDTLEADGRGYALPGRATGDLAGWSVASGGDVDGDGLPDPAVGAPGADPQGRSDAGEVLLWSGSRPSPPEPQPSPEPTPEPTPEPSPTEIEPEPWSVFAIHGPTAGASLGWSVSSAGDLTGDGYDDVAVGAPGSPTSPGQAFVVSSRSDQSDVDLASLGGDDLRVVGTAPGGRLGRSVTSLGDIDGDGVPDVAFGAPGSATKKGMVLTVYGTTGDLTVGEALASSIAYRTSLGARSDLFGASIGALRDLNGDGSHELLVGSPAAKWKKRPKAGRAYTVPTRSAR